MGRKKWNRLTERGKDSLAEKIIELQLKLTNIEDHWDHIYDLEETINDNIKTLLECNADCTSCTENDRASCLLNFRKANVFYLAKLKTYEEFFYDSVNFLINFLQGLYKSLKMEDDTMDDDEEEPEIIDRKPDDPPRSLFV